MARATSEIDLSNAIRAVFPDDNEREQLVGIALAKVSADAKPSKRGNVQIPVADIVIEMLRARHLQSLIQLVVAMAPKQPYQLKSLLGHMDSYTVPQLSFLFGISAATIQRDWIPAGMPGQQ